MKGLNLTRDKYKGGNYETKRFFSLYVVMDMSESMSWKDSTGEAKIRTAMEIVPGIIEIAEKKYICCCSFACFSHRI